jgi:hypothetical protein
MLLDDIRERGSRFDDSLRKVKPELTTAAEDVVRGLHKEIHAFQVSDVVNVYTEQKITLNDFPSYRPPYDFAWFEAKCDIGEGDAQKKINWGVSIERFAINSERAELLKNLEYQLVEDAPFIHVGFGFIRATSDPNVIIGPAFTWILEETKDGRLSTYNTEKSTLDIQIRVTSQSVQHAYHMGASGVYSTIEEFIGNVFIFPMYAAIGFLHVRNVGTQLHEIAPRLQKARARRNRPALVEYRTLTIKPLSGHPSASKGKSGGGTAPIHFCRGHWAEYGPEYGKGLLFGKYAGKFWIPATVKGNREAGEIRKNYEVTQ